MMKVFEIFPEIYNRCNHATDGIAHLFTSDSSYRKHFVAAIIVVALGVIADLNVTEWTSIIICIGFVLVAEAFNSALEVLADRVTNEYDVAVKLAKDIAAGAVFVSAITALIVGLIIFVPKFITLIKNL